MEQRLAFLARSVIRYLKRDTSPGMFLSCVLFPSVIVSFGAHIYPLIIADPSLTNIFSLMMKMTLESESKQVCNDIYTFPFFRFR